MPTIVATRSGLAGDPRLAKLKEASFTRRRTLPTEHTIAAFRDETDRHELESVPQHDVEPSNNPITHIAPPLTRLMATGVALHILNLDGSATAVEGEESNYISRLQRLQAVRSLTSKETAAATGNAGIATLDRLRRRLHSTTAQLAFHEANAASQNAPSRKKPGDSNAPWLPSSTISGSKHKAAQVQANKKKTALHHHLHKENFRPPRPSSQASALQAKLLSDLKERLQLKGVLLALRQAVQRRHLLENLVERAIIIEKQATLKQIFTNWKEATLPTKEMICAAEFFDYERQIFIAKEALKVWKAWGVTRQQRRQAAVVGAATHQRRLLEASLAHWKFATNMKHLSMLRSALVEGWVDNWGRRKALLAWRRIARRQQLQRNALLAATAAGGARSRDAQDEIEVTVSVNDEEDEDHVVPGQTSLMQAVTLSEAAANQRAITRSQLSGLKLCVAEVAGELNKMRSGLRWTFSNENDSNVVTTGVASRPLYDPAVYSSPVKKRRLQGGEDPALAAAEEIAADLFRCNEELEQVENECQALRENLKRIEKEEAAVVDTEATNFLLAAQQAEQDVAVAMMAFEDAENELQEARVVVDIVNEEIELQKTLLEKSLHEARTHRAAADAAIAALASARAEHDTSSSAVEAWTKKVTLVAAELSRVAPSAKSAAALKLKEARHRLEMEKLAASEAHQEIPRLLQISEETAKQAQQTEAALMAAQKPALAASAAEAAASAALNSAQAAFSAAETALKEAQEKESSALSASNAAIERAAALHEDARQIRLQLFTREREVSLLQERVTELDEEYGQFVALSLEYQQQQPDQIFLLEEAPAVQAEPALSVDGLSSSSSLDSIDPGCLDEISQEEGTGNSDISMWSVATTPCSSPSKKDPLSITAACRSFYRSRLLRRAVHALRNEAAQWKELKTAASYGYCMSILPAAFEAWKEATADAVAIDGANVEILRVLSSLKAWRSYTAKSQLLRQFEEEYIEMKSMQKKTACFAMLRNNVISQQRHREALATAVTSRRFSLFNIWRTWAATQRQLSETLQVALERKRLRCLSSFMSQWRTNSHNNALLRRVLTTAIDSWRTSLGAAGYEAEYSLLQRCFAAWQVAAHVQLEERRDGVLALAAENTHDRSLLNTALNALRKEAEWASEKESYLPLAHAALLSWRETTLISESHLESLAAKQHYVNSVKEKVFTAWSGHATAIACRVSVFYMKWQVDQRRKSVLAAWRQVISERRKWELRRAEAEAVRSKNTSPTVGCIQGVPEIVVDVQQHMQSPHPAGLSWLTTGGDSAGDFSASAAGTTPSSGARSVAPVKCGSSESWHAKAEEWRQRRAFYSGGGGAVIWN